MDKPVFVYVTYINTSPDKLWEALTSPEFTQQYWGGRRIQSDWKIGSTVQHLKPGGGSDWTGIVLQADPPKVLSYTFGGGQAEKASRVTFEIALSFGMVKLVVTHDEFESGSRVFPLISQGWPAILSSLKTLLETGKPLPSTWKG